PAGPAAQAASTRPLAWIASAAILCALAALGGYFTARRAPAIAQAPVTRFDLPVSSLALRGFSVSPDGRTLAYTAPSHHNPVIWLRPLDSETPAQARAGTEDASLPVWSPDSKSIAFVAEGKLKRMDVGSGAFQVVCDGLDGQSRGLAWSSQGTIIYSLGAG